MAAHSTQTRTRLKKELFKKKEEPEEKTLKEKAEAVAADSKEATVIEESSKPAKETSTEDEKPPVIEDTGAEEIKEAPKEENKPQDTASSGKPSLKRRLMWGGLLLVYIVILAVGGYFMYQVGFKKGEEASKLQMEKQLEKEKAAVPTATPIPSVDKSKYKIKVLNGTGISGEAAKAKELLESDGFTVSTIGNASKQDNLDTTIATKEDVDSEFISALKEALEGSYKLGEVTTLDTSDPADIVVSLGGKK